MAVMDLLCGDPTKSSVHEVAGFLDWNSMKMQDVAGN